MSDNTHTHTHGATLRMKQIVAAPWDGTEGRRSYSLIALGEDGVVYRFDVGCQGWFALPMKTTTCEHRR